MKKLLIFAGLAVLLVGLPLISKMNRGGDAETVEVHAVGVEAIKSSILASGTLAFREQVQLRSEVIARATAVLVEESDPVGRGELVITLDTESYDAQVEQAEASVRIQQLGIERQRHVVTDLERQYRNAERLVGQKLIDQDSFDALGNRLEVARVELRSQQEALSQARAALAQSQDLLAKTQIVSPIDGIVIAVDIKPGETVIAGTTNIPGSTLMTIADPSEMLVEVLVDEANIASVREGQGASIFAAAWPDTALTGTVESIAPTARQNAGQQGLTFLVKILLDEQDEIEVRSGMSARAEIHTESSDSALSVPIQAVRYDDEADSETESGTTEESTTYVFVFEDGVARRREVDTGISSDSSQEILAGLEEGELVITGPFRTLRTLDDGDPVERAEDDGEDAGDSDDDGDTDD
ncbi:efflux RND transporter periplasmic adaptor subunit [Marinihelvus fidelis]|uniref:Efflux RND transporter periplasmic adaptor subunit n=1 Tax=Marinihelvus fidelis TaxID=2613842 RepID=A0A5N0TEI8_9GAMM|nr:efflux RND transporter periplasmic adaptor subunit [Marinihelvus fidelis]KAA9132507.1 efflux RND transporter periplasmic adaptor subunit [Marinihelvus fidelis]